MRAAARDAKRKTRRGRKKVIRQQKNPTGDRPFFTVSVDPGDEPERG